MSDKRNLRKRTSNSDDDSCDEDDGARTDSSEDMEIRGSKRKGFLERLVHGTLRIEDEKQAQLRQQ